MAQSFPEKAHLRTDTKKFGDNFDSIDWTKKEEKKEVEEVDSFFITDIRIFGLSQENGYEFGMTLNSMQDFTLPWLKKLLEDNNVEFYNRSFFVLVTGFDSEREYQRHNDEVFAYLESDMNDELKPMSGSESIWYLWNGSNFVDNCGKWL